MVSPAGRTKHKDCHNWRMDVQEAEKRWTGAQMTFESHAITFLIMQVTTSIYDHFWVLLPSSLKHTFTYIWASLKQRKKTKNFQRPPGKAWFSHLQTQPFQWRKDAVVLLCHWSLPASSWDTDSKPFVVSREKEKGDISTKTHSLLCT